MSKIIIVTDAPDKEVYDEFSKNNKIRFGYIDGEKDEMGYPLKYLIKNRKNLKKWDWLFYNDSKEKSILDKEGFKTQLIERRAEEQNPEVIIEKRKFIMVTNENFSGLGFALQEAEQNNSEVIMAYKYSEEYDEFTDKEKEACEINGKGLVNKVPLDDIMAKRNEYKDWYFIWDMNCNWEESEILRKEGFKVFGGSKFTCDLENDREFGTEFAKSCGLMPPPTFEFSSADEGISFLEQNEDKAYVFKPNASSDNSITYVPINEEPANANLEMIEFIKAFQGDSATSAYILQEIVKGVEINIEGFYVNGECVFAHANFEEKKNYQENFGQATGCAFDVEFEIDKNSKLFEITVGKMSPKLKEMNYTGPADANVIIGDFQKVYFLEFCYREGYNSSINLFFNLLNKTMLQTRADMIDGIHDIKCKSGFGSAITMYTEKYKIGLPIYIPESVEKDVFIFDGYKEEDKLKMAGVSHDILVVCAQGYTVSETLHEAEEKCRKILFKDRYFRLDTWEHKIPRSCQRRYEAIKAMGLI